MNERDSRFWFSAALARLERRHLTQYVRRFHRQRHGTLSDGMAADVAGREADYLQLRDTDPMHNRLESPVINRLWIRTSRPLSDEELHFHAQLSARLLELNRERSGFWSRIGRLLLGNRLDP
jgi:hypothetical protein